uniref:Uncharacterized protein n=1 Tax=Oryza glaberrima TaxID=4538 RepID=I1NQK6_ORYGL
MAMLGRKRGGSSSAKLPPHAEDPRAAPPPPQAGLTATDGGQEVAMSQFVAQLGIRGGAEEAGQHEPEAQVAGAADGDAGGGGRESQLRRLMIT